MFPVSRITFLREDTRLSSLSHFWHHFSPETPSLSWDTQTLADVTRHVSPVTKLSRGVFPGPRLSQHWLWGPDTRETRARDNSRAPTPGHPGSLCCCKFYSRGNIKIFSQTVTHANTTIGRGRICLMVVFTRVEIFEFCKWGAQTWPGYH